MKHKIILLIYSVAKAIEVDSRIPAQSTFVQLLGNRVSKEELRHAEQTLLKLLDWKLILTTTYDLISYYISLGLVFTTDEMKHDQKYSDKIFLNTVAPSPDFINDPVGEAPNTPDEVEDQEKEVEETYEKENRSEELAYIDEKDCEEDDGIFEHEKEPAKIYQTVGRLSEQQLNLQKNTLQALAPKIERQVLIICDDLLRGF